MQLSEQVALRLHTRPIQDTYVWKEMAVAACGSFVKRVKRVSGRLIGKALQSIPGKKSK